MDFRHPITALDQRAHAEITYGVPVGADYAEATVTVVDYTKAILAAATGTITIVDYTQLAGVAVTVGGETFTEGVDWTAAVSNDATATSLALAIDGGTQGASAVSAVVTVTAGTSGAAGNAIALSSTDVVNLTLSGATLTGGQDNLTINVDGNALVQGTDFTAETSNAVTATNIAAAIDALSGINAVADGVIVTIADDARGTAGNARTLTTSSTAAATVSGATFSGGVDGDTVVVDGTTLTCVVGTAGAGEFSSITELEVLTEAISGIDSTQDGTTVNLYASSAGAAGNAKTLALGGSNAGTMDISGATFSGGADYTYTDAFQVRGEQGVQIFTQVDTLASGTLDVTPEVSADKVNWLAAKDSAGNAITFTQFTSAGSQQKWVQLAGQWIRCKLDIGGANAVVTGHVQFVEPC